MSKRGAIQKISPVYIKTVTESESENSECKYINKKSHKKIVDSDSFVDGTERMKVKKIKRRAGVAAEVRPAEGNTVANK